MVALGNNTCGPVVVGTFEASIFQESRTGVPYLWCQVRLEIGKYHDGGNPFALILGSLKNDSTNWLHIDML